MKTSDREELRENLKRRYQMLRDEEDDLIIEMNRAHKEFATSQSHVNRQMLVVMQRYESEFGEPIA